LVQKFDTSEIGRKYLESFEIWCWRRMEKISLTDRVRNEEVLQRVKEDEYITYNKRRKAKGHILLRSCLLDYVIEGKTSDGKTRKKTSAATG